MPREDTNSMSATGLRYTKSFKKYTDEFQPEVVEHVRQWARVQDLAAIHEDASLVKVTGSKQQIESLLAELKEKFDYVPPEDRGKGEKKTS